MGDVKREGEAPDMSRYVHGDFIHLGDDVVGAWSQEQRDQYEQLLAERVRMTTNYDELLSRITPDADVKVDDHGRVTPHRDPGITQAVIAVNRFLDRLTVMDDLGERLHLIQLPPGYGMLWFADFFYSRKSVEEYLRPTIQDLQDEYVEALAAKRPHKARWVRIRGTWSFVCTAGLLTMASAGKQVVKIWRAVG